MRKTGSVTQKDIPLSKGDQLVTSTTPKGVITEVNETFCKFAGLGKDELIGQAHNIIRHPDMPPAAFKLLWDTVNAGRSWRGIVKNRANNGDHYWVDAYITPTYEDGKIVSLESVRQKAEPACIKRAEQAYQAMNNGRAPVPTKATLIEKNIDYIKALGLGSAGFVIAAVLGGSLGWIAGLVFIGLALSVAAITNTQADVNKQLSRFNDDELTQYIYTGHLTPSSRVEFATQCNQRHLHTVLERMDQQGERLKSLSAHNKELAQAQFSAIQQEKEQLDGVASAVQEMSHSVTEIAHTAESSASTTGEANDSVKRGDRKSVV